MLRENIHGSCVVIGRAGVLLLGPSGAGKSDLTLRLMDEGARLVADDRTDLFVQNQKLMARAPAAIAGLIEVRGLGIIARPYAKTAAVMLAVELGRKTTRLPVPAFYAPLKAAKPVPLMTLDAGMASATARIRLALAAFSQGLFRESFNPS